MKRRRKKMKKSVMCEEKIEVALSRLIHINLLEFHTLFWVVYILLKCLRLSGSSMYAYVHFHQ